MTVSDIINAAKQYTQIDGSSWFSDADALRSVNRSYRDLYEKILDSNDEYFIKEIDVPISSLSVVRDYVYDYPLPADWYRLRRLAAVLPAGDHVLGRIEPQALNKTEGYRYFADRLRISYRGPEDTFRIEYYPKPVEYTALNETIIYPPQLEPLILSYQIAMDIAKAQNGDATRHAEEYARLWQRFEHAATRRDNLRYPRVTNTYRSTYPGW
jgi:hypothetical protein